MKSTMKARLARISPSSVSYEPEPPTMPMRRAALAIIAHHTGGWAQSDAVMTGVANALNMTPQDFKHMLSFEGDALWARLIEKLDALISARAVDGDGTTALYELYAETPVKMRERLGLPEAFPFAA